MRPSCCLLALSLILSCKSEPGDAGGMGSDGVFGQNDQYYELNPVRDVDILFLIDNSPSMGEEQGLGDRRVDPRPQEAA